MKYSNDLLKQIRLSALLFALLVGCIPWLSVTQTVYAKESTESVEGKLYIFDDAKSEYEISDVDAYESIVDGTDYGSFSITGAVRAISSIEGIPAYEISDGNVLLSYQLNDTYSSADETKWHYTDDKSKKVDGEKLDENILSGALILQTSLTSESWIADCTYTDIVGQEPAFEEDFYVTKDIQQVNGCYYRVIVVYEIERRIDDRKLLFLNVNNYEKVKYAEEYEFYLINNKENSGNTSTASTTPRTELGSKIKAEKADNGYAGNATITSKDPHYGWDLGTFTINGYTRATTDADGNVFLKNVGDRATLWFTLKQDINALNGKDDLVINEDKKGWDQWFEISETNFKRGTLIIRYTDYEGNAHEPIVYTDYLAANTRTGADTKVELFEEGDYEVALDYEIRDKEGIDSLSDYRIYFAYKIRNGNCMVYPFDIVSGSELVDGAITENGFKLDMAKSRYLTIDVKKTVFSFDGNSYFEDVRFNRPAKDGESYSDEGMYTFTVKNIYTGESTIKNIYVGTSPILRALSSTGKTVGEINNLLVEGAEIGEDGIVFFPSTGETIEESETDQLEEISEIEESDIIEDISVNASVTDELADVETEVADDENSINNSNAIIIVLISVLVTLLILVIFKISNDKKKIAIDGAAKELKEEQSDGNDAVEDNNDHNDVETETRE